MRTTFNSELARAINETAHALAAHQFAAIRMRLRERARALAKEGKTLDETLQAIRSTVVHHETPVP